MISINLGLKNTNFNTFHYKIKYYAKPFFPQSPPPLYLKSHKACFLTTWLLNYLTQEQSHNFYFKLIVSLACFFFGIRSQLLYPPDNCQPCSSFQPSPSLVSSSATYFNVLDKVGSYYLLQVPISCRAFYHVSDSFWLLLQAIYCSIIIPDSSGLCIQFSLAATSISWPLDSPRDSS